MSHTFIINDPKIVEAFNKIAAIGIAHSRDTFEMPHAAYHMCDHMELRDMKKAISEHFIIGVGQDGQVAFYRNSGLDTVDLSKIVAGDNDVKRIVYNAEENVLEVTGWGEAEPVHGLDVVGYIEMLSDSMVRREEKRNAAMAMRPKVA